jgi:hypothetical protein
VAPVGQTVDGAMAVMQAQAELKGLSLTARFACDISTSYEGDEDRVRQILVNLLDNAVKFTASGGHIAVECGLKTRPDSAPALRADDNWLYLRVSDTGAGIPAAQLSAIFDPFVQVVTGPSRPKDGSGLGLTIGRRLARAMKGDITVQSELGKGSAFTLWLRVAPTGGAADVRANPPLDESRTRLRGTADVGEALVHASGPIVTAFVARLRLEPAIAAAATLRFSQLADHVGTFVANLGGVLVAVEESRGQPSGLVADGTEIQRVVAERHGAQRARLGWTAEALHCEWQILAEEIERAVHAHELPIAAEAQHEALTIVRRFVQQAEELSCRALTRTVVDDTDVSVGRIR